MRRMSGTFACPHCGAQYPIKPVLVGRAVRCTTCKQPFRLREDGVADKVEDAAPPPTPAAAAPAPAPAAPAPATAAPAAPAPKAAAPVPAAAATPEPAASTNRPTRTRTDRIDREQMEAQRRTMAASLATAATAALQSEAIKREAAAPEKRTKTDRMPASKPPNGEGRVGTIGPVVLTGYGENEHRNNMIWLFGSIAVIAVVVTLIALLSMRSEQRKALDAFTAVVEGERGRYGERMIAIQERAWLSNVSPLVNLGKISIHSVRTLPMTGAGDVIASLKGLTHLEGLDIWVPATASAQAETLWDTRRDRPANLTRLTQARIQAIDGTTVSSQLQEAGWSESDAGLLMRMLTGRTNRSGENWIASKLLDGELPDAIEICPFRGTNGELLADLGRSYVYRKVDYEGLLLRFVGNGWPSEWKVLDITTSSRE